MTGLRITPKRLRVLRAAEATGAGVEGHGLTFEDQYRRKGGIRIFRMFEPGVEGYALVTSVVGPLFAAGLLTCEHASWDFGRGHVYLTPAGSALLRAWED